MYRPYGHLLARSGHARAQRQPPTTTYFYLPGGATSAKVMFSLITNENGGVGGGVGVGSHTVGARGGQQGVRARVRAAGKALDGDDRHIYSRRQVSVRTCLPVVTQLTEPVKVKLRRDAFVDEVCEDVA